MRTQLVNVGGKGQGADDNNSAFLLAIERFERNHLKKHYNQPQKLNFGKESSDEEGEENDEEIVESKSLPFWLEAMDPGKNENDISRAQKNGYSPKMEEGKMPEGGGLQSKDMRQGGRHAVKPGSTAQLKYTNKPQDEGLSDKACTKADQVAVANTADTRLMWRITPKCRALKQ